jgi:hypothetical protein
MSVSTRKTQSSRNALTFTPSTEAASILYH